MQVLLFVDARRQIKNASLALAGVETGTVLSVGGCVSQGLTEQLLHLI